MNIVQIIPALDAGGAERTVVDITAAVVEAGGAALIITTGGRLEREVIAAGGQIAHLPVASKNPVVMGRNIGRIVHLAQAFDAQLIHARSRAPAWSTYYVAKQVGLPFVTTYHGTYNARSALKRAYNAIMAKGDGVIANSQFIARHIVAEHGLEARKITVIPRGVDPVFFGVAEKVKVPGKAPVIMLPGRLTRWKGQFLAIEALSRLHRENGKAILVLAGDAQGRHSYVEALQAQVKAAGLGPYVRFSGHIENMTEQYETADIVLSASTEPEAFGRVTVEAQASARLAIAPAHGGALETLIDGKTGFHFIPGDVADLARVLQKATRLAMPDYQQMCQRARNHAHEHYSQGQMCAKTLGVYRELLKPCKGH